MLLHAKTGSPLSTGEKAACLICPGFVYVHMFTIGQLTNLSLDKGVFVHEIFLFHACISRHSPYTPALSTGKI